MTHPLALDPSTLSMESLMTQLDLASAGSLTVSSEAMMNKLSALFTKFRTKLSSANKDIDMVSHVLIQPGSMTQKAFEFARNEGYSTIRHLYIHKSPGLVRTAPELTALVKRTFATVDQMISSEIDGFARYLEDLLAEPDRMKQLSHTTGFKVDTAMAGTVNTLKKDFRKLVDLKDPSNEAEWGKLYPNVSSFESDYNELNQIQMDLIGGSCADRLKTQVDRLTSILEKIQVRTKNEPHVYSMTSALTNKLSKDTFVIASYVEWIGAAFLMFSSVAHAMNYNVELLNTVQSER